MMFNIYGMYLYVVSIQICMLITLQLVIGIFINKETMLDSFTYREIYTID